MAFHHPTHIARLVWTKNIGSAIGGRRERARNGFERFDHALLLAGRKASQLFSDLLLRSPVEKSDLLLALRCERQNAAPPVGRRFRSIQQTALLEALQYTA